ncbi:MAG: GGDEF domain-containing protein, partial [Saccharopolyspora rectivirgula]
RVPWLLLIDIDYFKEINDQAGHSTGDVVLQEIAHLLRRECRSEDLLCRWAGDEFIVLIGENSGGIGSAGPIVARRIQDAVRSHDWRLVTGRDTINPTVSIGVAAGPPASVERLFQRADTALYRAKAYGRNTVEVVIRDSD